ncbi:MAG: DUF1761 domain-containing protein [Terracidiphilus sp.]
MASDASGLLGRRVRQNYVAILVAGIVCFLLEAAWYSFFNQAWLAGTGRTREWLMSQGVNPAFQYGIAILAAIGVAAALSYFVQSTGPQTVVRGVATAFLLWLGFVLTIWATEYAFELRPLSLFWINTGFWLLGMVVMGAIVGAWKAKGSS